MQARYIISKGTATKNVILKVTTPRWTGRKRKRGSEDAFRYHDDQDRPIRYFSEDGTTEVEMPARSKVEAPELLKILRDNKDRYSVAPLGRVTELHRFRGLPDFQYATTTDPLMMKVRNTIQTFDPAKCREFAPDPHRGLKPGENIGVPPLMNILKTPHVYSFKQSLTSRVRTDEHGNTKVKNVQEPTKYDNQVVMVHDPGVPTGPPDTITPEAELDRSMKICITKFRQVLEKRPIMVKRVQEQLLPGFTETQIRRSWPYVGYMFKQGPFRDAIIKYGVDPRSDSKYRGYQTLFYQLPQGDGGQGGMITVDEDGDGEDVRTAKERGESRGQKNMRTRYSRKTGRKLIRPKNSHIFDGKSLCRDGKTWQIDDITDELLLPLTTAPEVAEVFDPEFAGWYCNGTWSLLRVLMKEKINILAAGKEPDYDMEGLFKALIAAFPARIDEENLKETLGVRHENTVMWVRLSGRIRTFAKSALARKDKSRDFVDKHGDNEMEVDPALEGGGGANADAMDVDEPNQRKTAITGKEQQDTNDMDDSEADLDDGEGEIAEMEAADEDQDDDDDDGDEAAQDGDGD